MRQTGRKALSRQRSAGVTPVGLGDALPGLPSTMFHAGYHVVGVVFAPRFVPAPGGVC
ncbi:hypothetical protein [Streptomyces sp. NL15-2K]|uniref:hypothetical protein n=1 Tax=Streptomyces sp. NL15-2K TaxID=376149 RepID=UPI00209BF231|nr:hypothetical protein [Streptomyces sp. NL15-2K]